MLAAEKYLNRLWQIFRNTGITYALKPTITAGAYAAGDNVGGLLTFNDASRIQAGGGIVNKLVIVDDAKQSAELELWLFRREIAAGADNVAWDPSEADLERLVDVISTVDGTWYNTASHSVCVVEIARRFDVFRLDLCGRLVTRGTPTYVSIDDLTVKLGLLRD